MFPTCPLLGSVLLLNAVSWDGPLSLQYIKSGLGWLIPSHIADKASLILSYRGPRQARLSAAAGQATCWPQFSAICSLCFLSAAQAAPSVPRDSCLRGRLPGATAEESRGPSQHSTPPHPVLHRPDFSYPPSETNLSSQCCLPGALRSGKLQPGQSQFPPRGCGCRSSSLKNRLRSGQAFIIGLRAWLPPPNSCPPASYSPSPLCPPPTWRL